MLIDAVVRTQMRVEFDGQRVTDAARAACNSAVTETCACALTSTHENKRQNRHKTDRRPVRLAHLRLETVLQTPRRRDLHSMRGRFFARRGVNRTNNNKTIQTTQQTNKQTNKIRSVN